MRYFFVPQRGFTILETLLYVGVSAIVLTVTAVFINLLFEARVKYEAISLVDQQGARALNIMTQTIRNAASITAPTNGTSAAALTVDTVSVAQDPIVFDLSSGVIRMRQGAAASVALTNARITASSLLFQNMSSASPQTIRIMFTLSTGSVSGRNEFHYEKSFIGSAVVRQQ